MNNLRTSLLLILAVFSFSSLSSSSPESTYSYFLRCLRTKTSNSSSNNISTTILVSQTNPNFSSVLQSYSRNLRFATPETQKPQLIITPQEPSHVSASVLCAKSINMQIKIRSGGHDFEGLSYISDFPFIILDMFNLRAIKVDAERQSAYVQAGATLGEMYYNVWKSSKVLGFPAGVCPTVGIGGHISGGGYGNMIRKYGLSVDQVVDAEIVDINGRLLNRRSMGEDLFWAIRGGGGASFGVVISFTVNLVPVPENVTVFRVERYLNQSATDLVFKWQTLMKDIDHNLFIRLLLQPETDPQTRNLTVKVTLISLFLGKADRLVALMNARFPELGLQNNDCSEMSWAESLLVWSNYEQGTPFEVLLSRTYTSRYMKRKSDYVKTPIPKEGLELLWKKLIELGRPGLAFNSYGGRMNEVPKNATPFPHREGNLYKMQYSLSWNEAGEAIDEKNINLIRKLHEFMTPYVSKNPRGAYLNYRDLDIGTSLNGSYDEGKVYGEKYFLGNFKRLVKVKTMFDPSNFFRNEQSIPPIKAETQRA